MLSLVIGLIFFQTLKNKDGDEQNALIIFMILNAIVFCIKPIAIDYYLLPMTFFCFAYGFLLFSKNINCITVVKKSQVERVLFSLVIIALCLSTYAHVIRNTTAVEFKAVVPKELLSKDAVVYADDSGGVLFASANKSSAKIVFGSFCMQEQLIRQVGLEGKEQFFIEDSQAMTRLLIGLGINNFEKIGLFRNAFFSHAVWRLTSTDLRPIMKCSHKTATLGGFEINSDIAAGIKVGVVGSVDGPKYVGRVLLTNESTQAFETFSTKGPIRLSWRFMREGGSEFSPGWDARANINMRLLPGESEVVPVILDLPDRVGRYRLEFSLVQDGVAWFHDLGMSVSTTVVSLP